MGVYIYVYTKNPFKSTDDSKNNSKNETVNNLEEKSNKNISSYDVIIDCEFDTDDYSGGKAYNNKSYYNFILECRKYITEDDDCYYILDNVEQIIKLKNDIFEGIIEDININFGKTLWDFTLESYKYIKQGGQIYFVIR